MNIPPSPAAPAGPARLSLAQEIGLVSVVALLGVTLALHGWHDAAPGRPNTFLNVDNLIDGVATPMSYYAIMAVGLTVVIITGGIDISVGSTMALAALGTAAALQGMRPDTSAAAVLPVAALVPLGIGLLCGLINGALIVGLNLHPFIVTPGTVKVVAVDALPAQLNYVRDGHVQVLLAQDCYGWGGKSVEILLEKIVNGRSPAEVRLVDPLTRVTRDNVDEYARNWDQWLGHR